MNYAILTFTTTPFGARCPDADVAAMIERLKKENRRFGYTGQYLYTDPDDPRINLVCTSESKFLSSPIAKGIDEAEALIMVDDFESRKPVNEEVI